MGRSSYHHGELREALITAADGLIREGGIEGFSLREAARRAGVSPGAPTHHFGSVTGLLTEVAILAYEELDRCLSAAPRTGSPTADLHAVATAYVEFAMNHPGRFKLMFRKDLVDRANPCYRQVSFQALSALADASADYHGVERSGLQAGDVPVTFLTTFASVHGIAHLSIEDKFNFALAGDDLRADFTQRLLPAILLAEWPERAAPQT